MISLSRASVVAAVVFCASVAAEPRVDSLGRLERLDVGKGWVAVRTELRVVEKGWGKTHALAYADGQKAKLTEAGGTWSATLGREDGARVTVEQVAKVEGGKMVFDLTATGKQQGEIEGVMFVVSFPTDACAGGKLNTGEQTLAIPEKLGEVYHVWNGVASEFAVSDAAGRCRVVAQVQPEAKVLVQDGRKWGPEFTAAVYVTQGGLAVGETAKLRVTLSAGGEVDATAANVAVDFSKTRYRITGIGGNYCFAIESPVTRYTLDHLRPAAARTEMSLRLWDPKSPEAESRVRQEMELMAELSRRKVPYVTSVWRMPPAMTEEVSPDKKRRSRHIGEAQWQGVLEAIGSYLTYAKEHYKAEPAYFSFNEPDIGVDQLFSPEEHRDAIKRVGAELERRGLKTKMLLGDVAVVRRGTAYAEPAAGDPEAMKYVGAVSFHSWGGATAEQYGAWADLAEKLKLPLIVAEAGTDAGAWRTRAYQRFGYAVGEMVHYQELLLHARPAMVMYWEFTGDYSLMNVSKGQDPAVSERLALQRHWCELVPAGCDAVAASSDQPAVLATAFRSGAAVTVHLANAKWERRVTVSGLPEGVKALNVVRTARGEMFRKIGVVEVRDGSVEMVLPAESLTSLTTADVGEVSTSAGQ